jgi:hypothetical protein
MPKEHYRNNIRNPDIGIRNNSQDVFNDRSGTVIAVVLTSQPQRTGFPLRL